VTVSKTVNPAELLQTLEESKRLLNCSGLSRRQQEAVRVVIGLDEALPSCGILSDRRAGSSG